MLRKILLFIITLYTVLFTFSANVPLSFIKRSYNLTCTFKMQKIVGNLSIIYLDKIILSKKDNVIKAKLLFLNKTLVYYLNNGTGNFKDKNNLIFIPEGLLRHIKGFWTFKNNSFVITRKYNDTYFVFYVRNGIIEKEFVVKERPSYIIEVNCS